MILITGIPRSRTSLTAAMLEACGADFGDPKHFKEPNRYNPLGYYEHRKVIGRLQNPYFEKIGFAPLDRVNMPSKKDIVFEPGWESRLKAIFGDLKSITAIKEPKLCLYWEQWANTFPDSRWIVVKRATSEIFESISKRTPWMRNSLEDAGWHYYIHHHLRRIEELKAGVRHWFEIDTGEVVSGDFIKIQQCAEWCGLTWNHEATNLVNPAYTFRESV